MMLVICLWCMSYSVITAQNHLCSEEFRTERDMKGVRIVGTDSLRFYVMDENRKENFIRITAYACKDLKMMNSNKIILNENEKLESISFCHSQFLVLTSLVDLKRKETKVYSRLIHPDGAVISDTQQVHELIHGNTVTPPQIGIQFSPDSTKFLLYFDPPYERKSSEAISFKCFSYNLQPIWAKEILLPYTQEIVQVHSFLLDNSGDVYMMSGRNPVKDGKLWQKPQGARYVVFYYNGLNNRLKEYDISLKDKQVVSVIFKLNKKQDVVITGYYSRDFHFNVSGTIQFVIGAHGAPMKSANFMPFSKEFLARFEDANDNERNPSLADYYLDHMIINDRGEVILIGEQYYVSQNTITDPTTGRQTIEYRYNFDDLIVTKTDSAGKHLWNQKIAKRQYTITDTRNCGYLCFETADSLCFYFNDDPDNSDRIGQDPSNHLYVFTGSKSSVTTRVVVHPDGLTSRNSFISNKEKDGLLNVQYGMQSPAGPQILGYEDGKNFRFCMVR